MTQNPMSQNPTSQLSLALDSAADPTLFWGELRHGGLLLSASALSKLLQEPVPALPIRRVELLRAALTPLLASEAPSREAVTRLLDVMLEDTLGYATSWKKGPDVDPAWGRKAMTGEVVKPRRLWEGEHGEVLPVFVSEATVRLGVGRGRREAARVVEWLRKASQPLALLTNGYQWRIVHAEADHDAFAEWDAEGFFEHGRPSAQLEGLRRVMHRPGKLIAAIQDSRKGQAELSQVLGERVRLAVELLIRAQAGALDAVRDSVEARDLYVAACRVIMRLVVVMFAEARDLLPRDNASYHHSYGLEGLRTILDRIGDPARRRHMVGAWPRLLALFRLIHGGSFHPDLLVPTYGGELFAPGDPNAVNGLSRALAALESAEDVSDQTVSEILDLLCRTRVRMRQGRQNTWVTAPVDFSDLSSEYIGILYEGLLDFELHRVSDDPMLFLNLGSQPVLPLSRLEALDDNALKALVETLSKGGKSEATEDSDGDDEGQDAETPGDATDAGEAGDEDPASGDEADADGAPEDTDSRLEVRDRARAWAERAVRIGKLIGARDLKDPLKVAAAARVLVSRTVMPGEWYLVRWGGTRKGSGTFYTRPQLAVPTVMRTLRPLAYQEPAEPGGEWTPRKPEEILAIKVCDPAMGSGSFLVAALRYLTAALYESLHAHERIRAHGREALVTLGKGKTSEGSLGEETFPLPPDDPHFEERLKAVLKRHVVENCLYGVDLNPLGVELGRLSLWVETMDPKLPFTFIDHKLKVGNSLVGAWLDTFQRYPAKAWERLGGDSKHPSSVHHPEGERTGRLAAKRDAILAELAVHSQQLALFQTDEGQQARDVLGAARAEIERLHALPPQATAERSRRYWALMTENTHVLALRQAMDTFCALWFWPSDDLETAPTPRSFERQSPKVAARVRELAGRFRFFHWELEFPDVFTGEDGGFSALVGNPPWDTRKPSSEEFFTNWDALYRTLSKTAALSQQRELFRQDPRIETAWLDHNEEFNAFTNWVRHVGKPFVTLTGSRGGKPSFAVESTRHPFHLQGSADLNLYKTFLEAGMALLKQDGFLGLITPSGIYSDKGTTELRTHFLDRNRWHWLFAFENRHEIFQIHRSFKFCMLIVQKGGRSGILQAAFMRHDPEDWQKAEAIARPFDSRLLESLSAGTRAFLEVQQAGDLSLLAKILEGAPRIGTDGAPRWGLSHAQEFHMTKEAHCFTPRDVLLAEGVRPDVLGCWVRPDGETLLPLYQGVSFHQFDAFFKGYVRGSGRQAIWRELTLPGEKSPDPQFLVSTRHFGNKAANIRSYKAAFRRVARNTDVRTLIMSLLPAMPGNDKVAVLRARDPLALALIVGLCSSFVLDWVARAKVAGTQVDHHILEELPLLPADQTEVAQALTLNTLRLNATHPVFTREWLHYRARFHPTHAWQADWAVTPAERLRLRAINDALVAHGFGLSVEEFAHILDPDPSNPKGFWRVDREKPPELRLTTLALEAFKDLQARGLDGFLAQHGGEGWMLPEFLEVDGEIRPVREPLGERFLNWQQNLDVAESWAECERHARDLLGDDGYAAFLRELEPDEMESKPAPAAPTGQLPLF